MHHGWIVALEHKQGNTGSTNFVDNGLFVFQSVKKIPAN